MECINILVLITAQTRLKTYMLSKSETSELLEKFSSIWPKETIPKVKNIKVYEVDENTRLLVAEETVAVQIKDKILPFVGNQREVLEQFPSVTVDMGAVRFVCDGARVMRPGIISFGSFKKSEIVWVKDQTHDKALAVGIALEDSEIAKTMIKGSIVENLHYVGDNIWEAYKQI